MALNFIKPSPLFPGDKVAILSPSSGLPSLFPWVYERGIQRIRDQFKLQPVEYPTTKATNAFLESNPQARAEDLNSAFADPSIKAIIATIGGHDLIRVLPYLDAESIRRNPKIFLGYSDSTSLHLYLWNLGIISYYGGAVMVQFAMGKTMHPYTVESLKKALFAPSIGEIFPADYYTDTDLDWADEKNLERDRPLVPCEGWLWHNARDNKIEGRLFGGCLETLEKHLSENLYLPNQKNLEGSILYLETSEEMPSHAFVYQFITSLAEKGLLEQFQALLMAYPKTQFLMQEVAEGRQAYILNQQQAVISALNSLKVSLPVIFKMNFGHTDPQLIIPNGASATINGKTRSIHFY